MSGLAASADSLSPSCPDMVDYNYNFYFFLLYENNLFIKSKRENLIVSKFHSECLV